MFAMGTALAQQARSAGDDELMIPGNCSQLTEKGNMDTVLLEIGVAWWKKRRGKETTMETCYLFIGGCRLVCTATRIST